MVYLASQKELDNKMADKTSAPAMKNPNMAVQSEVSSGLGDIPMQQADMELRALFESLKHQAIIFSTHQHCAMNIRTLEEADIVSNFLSAFFPEPERVQIGIRELLVNAIEHGNLAIGYEEKAGLMANHCWAQEVSRRITLPEHAHKFVYVTCWKGESGVHVSIRDTGKGFRWSQYTHLQNHGIKPNNGHGIASAKFFSFDKLEYNKAGNEVTGSVIHKSS